MSDYSDEFYEEGGNAEAVSSSSGAGDGHGQMRRRSSTNPQTRVSRLHLEVITNKPLTPFTFFKGIFSNSFIYYSHAQNFEAI